MRWGVRRDEGVGRRLIGRGETLVRSTMSDVAKGVGGRARGGEKQETDKQRKK